MWKIITKYNTHSHANSVYRTTCSGAHKNVVKYSHKNRLWNFLLFPAFSFSRFLSFSMCSSFRFYFDPTAFFSSSSIHCCVPQFLISAIFGSMQHFIINYNTLSRLVKLKLSVNFISLSLILGTFIVRSVRSFCSCVWLCVWYVRHIICCYSGCYFITTQQHTALKPFTCDSIWASVLFYVHFI